MKSQTRKYLTSFECDCYLFMICDRCCLLPGLFSILIVTIHNHINEKIKPLANVLQDYTKERSNATMVSVGTCVYLIVVHRQ